MDIFGLTTFFFFFVRIFVTWNIGMIEEGFGVWKFDEPLNCAQEFFI